MKRLEFVFRLWGTSTFFFKANYFGKSFGFFLKLLLHRIEISTRSNSYSSRWDEHRWFNVSDNFWPSVVTSTLALVGHVAHALHAVTGPSEPGHLIFVIAFILTISRL